MEQILQNVFQICISSMFWSISKFGFCWKCRQFDNWILSQRIYYKVESNSKTIECEKDAKKDWEKEDNRQKKRCCRDWDEAHSYKSAHKPNWDLSGYENAIYSLKNRLETKKKKCPDYGYNSTKCHFLV